HLHYEYRVNGVFRNPQTVMLPGAGPIDARWREDFLARSAPRLASLDYPPGPMLVSRCGDPFSPTGRTPLVASSPSSREPLVCLSARPPAARVPGGALDGFAG